MPLPKSLGTARVLIARPAPAVPAYPPGTILNTSGQPILNTSGQPITGS